MEKIDFQSRYDVSKAQKTSEPKSVHTSLRSVQSPSSPLRRTETKWFTLQGLPNHVLDQIKVGWFSHSFHIFAQWTFLITVQKRVVISWFPPGWRSRNCQLLASRLVCARYLPVGCSEHGVVGEAHWHVCLSESRWPCYPLQRKYA